MGVAGEFNVEIRKKDMVAAALPIQEHWLPFSNLDLLLPQVDVGVFLFYKNNGDHNTTFGSMVSVLKTSLAKALVSYYAFAGEVVQNSVGEPELLCNNRGVEFTEAYADMEMEQINVYNPDQTIESKLVPDKKGGVLAIQATELKCGGIVVGCTFDHRIADAYSNNLFLVSWSEIANHKKMSVFPFYRRSLLNPRRPIFVEPSVDRMYVPISSLAPPKAASPEADHPISRIYYVKANQLSQLQQLASSDGDIKRTKLESFSAFLWKMVALAATNDTKNNKKMAKIGIVVDGRSRLLGHNKPSQMSAYFGNVLSIPYGENDINVLVEKPLSWVADDVHDFLENAVTKEHFLGLIDWVEAHRPKACLAKIYCSGAEDGPSVVVSSGQRFPVTKVDFGWGKPVLGSYHFPWGGNSGYVMPMPSPLGNGDWIVYMHLLKNQLELIENQASHIFTPLAWDHLFIDTSN